MAGDPPALLKSVLKGENMSKAEIISFSKINLPKKGWSFYRKKKFTKALRIKGEFFVETTEGTLTCKNGWLAIDSRGFPYPIADDEFQEIYEKI